MELIQTSLLLANAKGTDFEQVITEAKYLKTYWENGRSLEIAQYSHQYKDTSIRIQDKIIFTPLGIFEEVEQVERKTEEKAMGFKAEPAPLLKGARVHERLKRSVDTAAVQGYEYVLATLTFTPKFDVHARFGFSYENVIVHLVAALLNKITAGPNPIILENAMAQHRQDFNCSSTAMFIIRYDILQQLAEALEKENEMVDKVEELLAKGYFRK